MGESLAKSELIVFTVTLIQHLKEHLTKYSENDFKFHDFNVKKWVSFVKHHIECRNDVAIEDY